MATQNSKPSGQVGSPTTPTGEESVTPIPQPSGLRALSASMSIEPERKTEAIQRAQVGSLMGANGNNEPPNKSPKRQTPVHDPGSHNCAMFVHYICTQYQ